jgi:hypothetical protein
MRKEQTWSFSQKDFLKRLGFPDDAILIEVFTFQFMEDERKINVKVNLEVPNKTEKPTK